MELRVKRLDPELPLPRQQHPDDAGYDLHARDSLVLAPAGVAGSCPPVSRSPSRRATPASCCPAPVSRSEHGVTCLNTPGLIDSLYRGELKVLLVNTDPHDSYTVERGDRIAQLVIQRWRRWSGTRSTSSTPPRATGTASVRLASESERRRHAGCAIVDCSRGRGSAGRAQPCQGWGRGFESRRPLHEHAGQRPFGVADSRSGSTPVSCPSTRRHASCSRLAPDGGGRPAKSAGFPRRVRGSLRMEWRRR